MYRLLTKIRWSIYISKLQRNSWVLFSIGLRIINYKYVYLFIFFMRMCVCVCVRERERERERERILNLAGMGE